MAVVVPRVFHRIWLGSRIPPEFVRFGQSWLDVNPGWTMILWTEDNLPEMRNRHLFDRAAELSPDSSGRFRFASDVLRCEVLEQFGGLYVDTDFEALRCIEPVIDGLDCFAVWEKPGLIANGLMGATPGHPFMTALVDGMEQSCRDYAGQKSWVTIGPAYVSRVAEQRPGELVALPTRLFLPYHHSDLRTGTAPKIPDDAIAHHVWGSGRQQVSVVIPWRASDAHRQRAFDWLVARIESEHPDWQVVPATFDAEPFNKAQAIIDGVALAFGDIIVVHDADSWLPGLPSAVDAVRRGAPWAVPFDTVHRLDEASSTTFMATPEVPIESLTLDMPSHRGLLGGGCLVLTRRIFEQVPPDVRFEGWGGEDEAWGDALSTLVGAPARIAGPLLHLWHPRDPQALVGHASAPNMTLAALYRAASGNKARMTQVVNGTPDGQTVTLRNVRTGRTRNVIVGRPEYDSLINSGQWIGHLPAQHQTINMPSAVRSRGMAGDILHGIGKRPRITRAETVAQDTPKQDDDRAAAIVANTIVQAVSDRFGRVRFDPSEHTVAEVLAHVAEHPEQIADIVLAEQAGKARKRIVALGDDLPF